LWSSRFAVKRINRQARALVFRVRDVLVGQSTDSVFGRKERDELYCGRSEEHVDRLPPFAIATCVIRHESDSHAREWLEVVALEDVDTSQYPGRISETVVARSKLLETLDGLRVVVRQLRARALDHSRVRNRSGRDRRNAPAQWSNIPFP